MKYKAMMLYCITLPIFSYSTVTGADLPFTGFENLQFSHHVVADHLKEAGCGCGHEKKKRPHIMPANDD